MKALKLRAIRLENQCRKVALYDGVLDTLHRDLEQVCVGRVCKMNVNLPAFGAVKALELIGEVF